MGEISFRFPNTGGIVDHDCVNSPCINLTWLSALHDISIIFLFCWSLFVLINDLETVIFLPSFFILS